VGVTTADDYPPALVDTLPAVSALPLDFEAVVAREPGLVLATDQVNSPGDAETLAALGVPVYVASFEAVADVFAAVETVGRLAGTAARATAAADSLRRALAALRRRTAARPT
jgi:iron complex transport system substrate-binding protein